MPTISQSWLCPASVTARMTALRPGASPPPVDTAMRLIGRPVSATLPSVRQTRQPEPLFSMRSARDGRHGGGVDEIVHRVATVALHLSERHIVALDQYRPTRTMKFMCY